VRVEPKTIGIAAVTHNCSLRYPHRLSDCFIWIVSGQAYP